MYVSLFRRTGKMPSLQTGHIDTHRDSPSPARPNLECSNSNGGLSKFGAMFSIIFKYDSSQVEFDLATVAPQENQRPRILPRR